MNQYSINELSVIIPANNEEETILELYQRLKNVLEFYSKDYELIFIDDGSTDSTLKILENIYSQDQNHIKVLSFRKNLGKSDALMAGFALAKFQYVVTCDADLQDDVTEIPKMIELMKQGYDVVSGWKFERKDPLFKVISSRIFNFVLKLLSGVQIHDFNCGFKAYGKEVIKEIKLYGSLHRFIPLIAKMRGFRIAEIKVTHHERKFGKSKYGIKRIFEAPFDLLTMLFLNHYKTKPSHAFGLVGFLLTITGFMIRKDCSSWNRA